MGWDEDVTEFRKEHKMTGNPTASTSAEVPGYTPFGVAVVYAMVAVQKAKKMGEGKEEWETLHILDCCESWLKSVSDAAKK